MMFNLLQWTWGIIQTSIGAVIYLYYRARGFRAFGFHGACVTVWDKGDSVSLGKFIFLTRDPLSICRGQGLVYDEKGALEYLLMHEYGHSVQSMILGPLYLLLVGLPSFLWGRVPYLRKKWTTRRMSYYDPIFEKSANMLGARAASGIER